MFHAAHIYINESQNKTPYKINYYTQFEYIVNTRMSMKAPKILEGKCFSY